MSIGTGDGYAGHALEAGGYVGRDGVPASFDAGSGSVT
ncbi:MAG: hypothetical protein JWQ18_910 [Conexibacter sp.]|nr:hypothetical protein [Conexibacter sp.]